MTVSNELKDRLSRYRQIKLSVVGRKSGKTITNPVWFVAEGDTLYLLPVHGSDTQWTGTWDQANCKNSAKRSKTPLAIVSCYRCAGF